MTTCTTPDPITTVLHVPAGHVHVTAGDRVDTTVEIRPADATKGRDVQAAEQATVTYDNGVLRIEAAAKNQYFGPSGAIAVTVGLPAGSRVEVTASSVELHTTGQLADVTVTSDHGRIDVEEAANARLTTVAGDVTVGRLTGPAQIRTSKGDIRITEAVRGSVVLRTDAGNVAVGVASGVSATLDAGTSHGRIQNSLNNTDGARAALSIRATTAVGDILAHSR